MTRKNRGEIGEAKLQRVFLQLQLVHRFAQLRPRNDSGAYRVLKTQDAGTEFFLGQSAVYSRPSFFSLGPITATQYPWVCPCCW